MRPLLQYLATRLLVSALCAATQTALVDHECRLLRIDALEMAAAADGGHEAAAKERMTAVAEPRSDTLSDGSSKRLDLADASAKFTGRGSAAGSTSAPG
jgi:hypothetical protein